MKKKNECEKMEKMFLDSEDNVKSDLIKKISKDIAEVLVGYF
jgi:hypothetical protein